MFLTQQKVRFSEICNTSCFVIYDDFFYEFYFSFQIKEGPPLNFARYAHCCGKMLIHGKIILVVAGGSTRNICIDTVELLDPTSDKGWVLGNTGTVEQPSKLRIIVLGSL